MFLQEQSEVFCCDLFFNKWVSSNGFKFKTLGEWVIYYPNICMDDFSERQTRESTQHLCSFLWTEEPVTLIFTSDFNFFPRSIEDYNEW